MPKRSSAHKSIRKNRFRAALMLAGMTQREWAAKRGVTEQHVIYVLRGSRESASLVADVDAFIAEQLSAASAA